MRTCYLHIGAPKAGSTTIQGFLGVYRDRLAASGLDAPDFGHGDVVTGPLALSGELKRETDPERPRGASWRWLDRYLPNATADVCISREGLCNHLGDREQLDFATGFFARHGMRLKLIAYVRDHVGYMNAAYAQQAKKLRLTEDFEGWLDGALEGSRYAYWRRFRLMFEDGAPDFSVTSLHGIAEGGLLGHFCGEIDRPRFDTTGFDPEPFRNATPGPKALAAGVLVGRELKARGVDPDANQSLHRVFRLAVEARGWRERPFFGPDAATTARIEQAFAKGDGRLAESAWGLRWPDAAPTTRRPRNVVDLATASAAERAEVEDLAREVLAAASPSGWKRLFVGRA